MGESNFVFLGPDAQREFEEKVEVDVPGVGKQVFTAKFLDLPQSKQKELTDDRDNRDALIMNVLIGWDGIEDKDGKPLPFNTTTVKAALDFAYFATAVYDAYFNAVSGRRLGNWLR